MNDVKSIVDELHSCFLIECSFSKCFKIFNEIVESDKWINNIANKILEKLDSGKMLIAYSGGLHHVQAPGDLIPKIFKTKQNDRIIK